MENYLKILCGIVIGVVAGGLFVAVLIQPSADLGWTGGQGNRFGDGVTVASTTATTSYGTRISAINRIRQYLIICNEGTLATGSHAYITFETLATATSATPIAHEGILLRNDECYTINTLNQFTGSVYVVASSTHYIPITYIDK